MLPLLRAAVVDPGFVSDSAFLAGYGAAQAMPGPLFTFGAYLGAVAPAPGGAPGAALALVAIFLPGMLILLGALPFWHALRTRPGARAAMAGVNAAVVGLLASALYDPVWTGAVRGARRFRRRRDRLRRARRLARAPARRRRADRRGGRRSRRCGDLGRRGFFGKTDISCQEAATRRKGISRALSYQTNFPRRIAAAESVLKVYL